MNKPWVLLATVLSGVGVLLSGAVSAVEPRDELARERRLVETYRDMLSQEPGQEYAFRRLLESAHVVGGIAGLIRIYQAEIEADPKAYASWLVLGQLHRVADASEAAQAAFVKAAALQPGRAEPHLAMAALFRDRREFEAAFAAYDRGVALLRERALKQEALRAAAEAAVEAKDGARAEGYFDKLAQTEPQNLFLRMQAASALARLDEPALALGKWREIEAKAQGQLQHLVIVWKEMAELQALLGRYEEAEATWRKGLERLGATHYERRTYLQGLTAIFRRQDRLRELAAELAPKAGRDVEVLLTLARIHEELAEDDRALAYYREAQERRPGDEEPRMAALRILERIGRPDEVLAAWVELVRAFPREARHQLKLAELYLQHNKGKEAEELMRKISRQHPSDPGVHARLVELYLRYGVKHARAEIEAEFKILQRLEPDEASHVVSLGEFYWSSGDKARADATWRRLLKLGRRAGEGHFLLGETYAEHDLHKDAERELRAAIAADPDSVRYRRALALLLERIDRHGEALEVWTELSQGAAGESRATPITREAREHIIQIWERAERLDKEIAALAQRFTAEPPDVAAGRFLAVALLRIGRVDEARATFERLDAIVADDLETLSGLEQVYTRLGEPKKAIAVLERLARVAPRAAVEYLHRAADLAIGMGDEASALKAARQVLELAPADATAHARVGELYLRMGHRSEAAESWRQALLLEPRNFPVRFKLASLYRDMGSFAREEQVLAEIVREAPEGADILRAGRRLLQLALATGRLAEVEGLLRPLVEPGGGGGPGRGRGAQLRLVVDVYGHLAQAIRFSDEPREVRDKKLAELGERALRPLLDALEDNDVATRARAIESLELTHPPGATPALARLAAEPESMAQVEAISALGRIASAGAVAALGRLGASPQAQTRELALWALGYAPTAEATSILTERARRGSPRDRVIAAAAIGFGRHPGALGLCFELLRDRSQDVREVALWALGRLAVREAVVARELADRLMRPATAREAQVAAWGLGQVGTAEARGALVGALFKGGAFGADEAIWTALAYRPEETARDEEVAAHYGALALRERGIVQPVRPTLYMPEPPDGSPSPGWLAELIGEPGRPGPLVTRARDILERGDAPARLTLAEALVRYGAERRGDQDGRGELSIAPARLVEARAPTQEVLVSLADVFVRALEEEREPRARDALLIAAASWPGPLHPERVRAVALSALTLGAEVPSRPLRGALMALAGDPALGAELAPSAREGLARALERLTVNPALEVRAALPKTLAALDDAPSQALLVVLAQDPVPIVRLAVCLAIAERATSVGPELERDLFDLVRDPLPDVSVAAVRALVAQGRPEVVARLSADPTPHVQRALRDTRRLPAPPPR